MMLTLMNVYFPYFKVSPEYSIDCCELVANLERVVNLYPNCSVVIAGDFNFTSNNNCIDYKIFKH